MGFGAIIRLAVKDSCYLILHSSRLLQFRQSIKMGRTTELEHKVKVLEESLVKLQTEAQNSVSALASKVKALEEIISSSGFNGTKMSNECSIDCPNKTVDQKTLRNTIAESGEHFERKKFVCFYCDKILYSNSGLVRHIGSKHSKKVI